MKNIPFIRELIEKTLPKSGAERDLTRVKNKKNLKVHGILDFFYALNKGEKSVIIFSHDQ